MNENIAARQQAEEQQRIARNRFQQDPNNPPQPQEPTELSDPVDSFEAENPTERFGLDEDEEEKLFEN